MADRNKLLILPGDGIGPEVMAEVRRVIDWLERKRDVRFDVARGPRRRRRHRRPRRAADRRDHGEGFGRPTRCCSARSAARSGTACRFAQKPERGLLRLRKEMELFANLRPAVVFSALVDASPLKPEIVSGLDIMIVRELTGGVYFGEPRGIEELPDGGRRGVNTQVYTTAEIDRIARVAFELARKRSNRVCSVEKANVMESGVLWREEVQVLHDAEYPDIALSHMYADNCAMQLIRAPKQFDVIVTDNLFGDMLSDEAAMLTGSLGMLPSASLGAADAGGRRRALYEPVHGSAPDIAGKGMANPLAVLLSFAMCLRFSFDMAETAELLENAVKRVLDGGLRTADIMQQGKARVSTRVMGEAIVHELDKIAA